MNIPNHQQSTETGQVHFGIACANVASLQLMRAAARENDLAIRSALGASQLDLVCTVLAEIGVLVGLGGLLAIGLSVPLVAAIRHEGAGQLAILKNVHFDASTAGFLLFASLVAAALCGAWPVVRVTRLAIGDVLKPAAARGSTTNSAQRTFLHTVIVAQIALAFVLFLSAGLISQTLQQLLKVNPGFRVEGVVTMRLALPDSRYSNVNKKLSFNTALLERVRAIPGVSSVGIVNGAPFGYLKEAEHTAVVRSRSLESNDSHANMWVVGGDYFRAMGIPLMKGRTFGAADGKENPQVAVVDEALARALFGRQEPIGMVLANGAMVVGVVGGVRKTDLTRDPNGSVYYRFEQLPSALTDITLVVRSNSTARVIPSLRRSVHELDTNMATGRIESLEDGVQRSLGTRRVTRSILSGLAVVGFGLTLMGIYAVLSYTTTLRRRELGLRVALGASPTAITRMILRYTSYLTLLGIGLGALGFVLVGRALYVLLYQVVLYDPPTVLMSACAVLCTAILATWIPARRAARVEPVVALRS